MESIGFTALPLDNKHRDSGLHDLSVYELAPAPNRYQHLMFVQEDAFNRLLNSFDGKLMKASWIPFEVTVLRDEQENHARTRLPSDFPTLGTIPVFSRRAVDALHDVLITNGELLPLESDAGEYYAYNVTRVVDALDETHSELTRFRSSGRVMMIDRYEFQPDKLSGISIFKMPQSLRARIYVTDAFVQRVASAGLVGFDFVPIWSASAVVA